MFKKYNNSVFCIEKIKVWHGTVITENVEYKKTYAFLLDRSKEEKVMMFIADNHAFIHQVFYSKKWVLVIILMKVC